MVAILNTWKLLFSKWPSSKPFLFHFQIRKSITKLSFLGEFLNEHRQQLCMFKNLFCFHFRICKYLCHIHPCLVIFILISLDYPENCWPYLRLFGHIHYICNIIHPKIPMSIIEHAIKATEYVCTPWRPVSLYQLPDLFVNKPLQYVHNEADQFGVHGQWLYDGSHQ